LALRNARPVEWLLDNAEVDARWTLVHATHLEPAETRGIARSGATVALCPTTEANLGDGLFPMRDYLAAGGAYGIGSDSHISVSPVEELRWLEYGQRLATGRRNIVASAASPSVCDSRRNATGFDGEGDALTLDMDASQLVGANDTDLADRWIFSGNRNLVDTVRVAGEQLVSGGVHRNRDAIAARYREAMQKLL